MTVHFNFPLVINSAMPRTRQFVEANLFRCAEFSYCDEGFTDATHPSNPNKSHTSAIAAKTKNTT